MLKYATNGKEIVLVYDDNTTTHFGDAYSAQGAEQIVKALNAIGEDPTHAVPGCGELLAHFKAMQGRLAAYIEPIAYTDLNGQSYEDQPLRAAAFIGDIIYMLDGPEQRAIEADLTNGGFEGDYVESLRARHPEAFEVRLVTGDATSPSPFADYYSVDDKTRSADHPNAI